MTPAERPLAIPPMNALPSAHQLVEHAIPRPIVDVTSSADTLAYCCTEADLASAPCWKDRAPTTVPRHLQNQALQDAIASACDRLARID
jgi:hypothetical protein